MSEIHHFSSPAKINHYLHIVGKRVDGYHLLDTEFQLLDFQDTVSLRIRKQDTDIKLHTPIAGLRDSLHLAVRAAHALQDASRVKQGVDIWVTKRIPSGAGLGGGSSNAATCLLALNALWGCGFERTQILGMGLSLGADVPFFCSGFGTARAQGVGEKLSLINSQLLHYVLIYPACHVSTPAVFKHPDLTWFNKGAIISGLTDSNEDKQQRYVNDLQLVAQKIAPSVRDALVLLTQGVQAQTNLKAVGMCMSGSGSAVFAAFDTKMQAVDVLNTLKLLVTPQQMQAWQMWVVSGIAKHPVLDQIDKVIKAR